MPFDQLFEPQGVKVPAGLPPMLHLLIAGGLCCGFAIVLPVASLSIGFAICGGILIIAGMVVGVVRSIYVRACKRLQSVAQTIVAHDSSIAFVTDQAGLIRYCNKAADDRFGTTKGTALSHVLGSMLANPDRALNQIIEQARATGAKTEDIVTRGGHFRLRVLMIGPQCQIWWLDDLSHTRRVGTARQEPLFPMVTVGPSGQVIHMNDSFRRLVGPTLHALDDIFDELPLRSGQTHGLRGVNGRTEVVVAITQSSDQTQDIYILPGAAFRDSQMHVEAGWDAIENLPVPLLKISPDGVLLASNREARQLLNLGTIGGRHLAEILDGAGRPINDWLAEILAGQERHVSQFLHGRGDKHDTFVQVTLNAAGCPEDQHVIAVLNDVTELKSLEAQFVQSQKMQAIGQLAGGVAHDFNNLLTAISGHCELLLCNHDEHDRDYSDLMQIHQNTNRAGSLVGQLLAFSRKQNLQPEALDLRDTLSDLTHLLNRLVGEKVSLKLDHDNKLARIRADKRQLEQVLMNLVVNARDAMVGGGEIKVVTKNTTLDKPLLRDRATVPAGDYVLVKVIDEGHGIPQDKLNKIFEPFVTTKRTGEGTGLGLSTAYGIVKQSGGYIFVDSEVGVGATFSLYFPAYTPVDVPAEAKPLAVAKPIKTGAEGVVLLVEDEAPVRAFAARALRLRGYTVLEATCAEDALEMLENAELHVDVFVTDVIMPGQDGPTWVRKALLKRPDTRVVFVSGYPEDAFDDGQPEVVGAVFLPKPFSLKALTDTVQDQLQAVPTLEEA